MPRKPWPLGNEDHTIACGKSGILYSMVLMGGKDAPLQHLKEFLLMGKTISLLLPLTRSVWGSIRVLVLDSSFCVLKGIVKLRKKGIFSSALIKNVDISRVMLMVK